MGGHGGQQILEGAAGRGFADRLQLPATTGPVELRHDLGRIGATAAEGVARQFLSGGLPAVPQQARCVNGPGGCRTWRRAHVDGIRRGGRPVPDSAAVSTFLDPL